MKQYKILRNMAIIAAVFVLGLYVGDSRGMSIGYEQGVIDHADSIVNEAKELRDRWRQDVDSLMASDTVIVTEREYTLIRQKQ